MLLEINDIAKMKKASIEINDITVITGQNNSGKSAIAKLVHAIYATINLYQNNYLIALKYTTILEELENLKRWVDGIRASEVRILYKELQSALFQHKRADQSSQKNTLIQNAHLGENINRLLANIQQEMSLDPNYPNRRTISAIIENIAQLQKQTTTNHSAFVELFERLLYLEFPASFISKFSLTESASITFKEDEKDFVQLNFAHNQLDKANYTIDLNKEYKKAIYLDDPFLLDNLPMTGSSQVYGGPPSSKMKRDHESTYRQRLIEQIKQREASRSVHNKRITNLLADILDGEVIRKRSGYYYFSKDFPSGIPFSALSSGMKTFAILQILIQNGLLANSEILILDEPETHLHPLWQLKLAELLVELNKSYSLKILITSHSPYFVEALDLFSTKLRTKFYCVEPDIDEPRASVLRDVTEDLEPIYAELYQPLCTLEKLRTKKKST
ncbi:AAA family ATPase [Enterococcus sp. AZ109]|uniref:AAA family ATPase n=1 Tax=Enterococcus sp. AZ109 TaxID=2774634 RepID=UPI003F684FA8